MFFFSEICSKSLGRLTSSFCQSPMWSADPGSPALFNSRRTALEDRTPEIRSSKLVHLWLSLLIWFKKQQQSCTFISFHNASLWDMNSWIGFAEISVGCVPYGDLRSGCGCRPSDRWIDMLPATTGLQQRHNSPGQETPARLQGLQGQRCSLRNPWIPWRSVPFWETFGAKFCGILWWVPIISLFSWKVHGEGPPAGDEHFSSSHLTSPYITLQWKHDIQLCSRLMPWHRSANRQRLNLDGVATLWQSLAKTARCDKWHAILMSQNLQNGITYYDTWVATHQNFISVEDVWWKWFSLPVFFARLRKPHLQELSQSCQPEAASKGLLNGTKLFEHWLSVMKLMC